MVEATGTSFEALVDTGANVSLASEDWVVKHMAELKAGGADIFRMDPVNLHGFAGQSAPAVMIVLNATLFVGAAGYKTHLFVVKNPTKELVLGTPFQYDAALWVDWKHKRIGLRVEPEDLALEMNTHVARDFHIKDGWQKVPMISYFTKQTIMVWEKL